MAAYLLQANSAFTVASGSFSTLVYNVISGEVTIDNKFYDSRVWGDASNGMSEGRGAYQAIGAVRAWHDTGVIASVTMLASFAPGSTVSAITMMFMTGKALSCNAHIHNYHVVGDRQSDKPVEVMFSFRSVGTLTSVTL